MDTILLTLSKGPMKISAIYGSTVASGRLGSIVASHNAGGLYLRNAVTPTDPATSTQTAQRARFTSLSGSWSSITQAQRDAWAAYGAAVGVTNSVGATIYVSGRNWYIGNNSLRLQAGLAAVADGPTNLTLAAMGTSTLTITSATSGSLAFTNSDIWASSTAGALMLYCSAPLNPTTNFFKGPYKYAGKVSGAAIPPTSPSVIALPYTVSTGKRVFYRLVAVEADGRRSAEATSFCTTVIA